MLFAVVDMARAVGVDPESALRARTGAFRREIEAHESRLGTAVIGSICGVANGAVGGPESCFGGEWDGRRRPLSRGWLVSWLGGDFAPDSGRGNPLRWHSAFGCG